MAATKIDGFGSKGRSPYTELWAIDLSNGDHDIPLSPGIWALCLYIQQAGGDSVVLTVAPKALNNSLCGVYSLNTQNGLPDQDGALTVTGAAVVKIYHSMTSGGTAAQTFNVYPQVINGIRITLASLTGTDEITLVATRVG